MSNTGSRTPKALDVRHRKLCGTKDTYCGHPRQGGIYYFGDGEIAVIHNHAPCAYQWEEDVAHDAGGYHSRSVALLQRSTDGGETWPEGNNVVVWDESAPLEERRNRLFQDGVERQGMDMSQPGSAIYFCRSWSGETGADGTPSLVCFALRSSDKGGSWEDVPTVVSPPTGLSYVHKDNHPVVRMPDGSLLGAMTASGQGLEGGRKGIGELQLGTVPAGGTTWQVSLYGSDDDGLTWEYLARVAHDPSGFGRPTYAGLLLLPMGRLLCFMLNIGGRGNFLCMNHSNDGGYSWSEPKPIVRWGASPWSDMRPKGKYSQGVFYRSPWPMLLRDGRILVLFARRKPPYGIGGIVSEDGGETWSGEFILRADASGPDIGYPVAIQMEDGRIFTAYYYMLDDGNRFGGSRFNAGTTFRLE